jgi:hypothetical protein
MDLIKKINIDFDINKIPLTEMKNQKELLMYILQDFEQEKLK